MCISLITDLTLDIKPGVNECLYQFVRANTGFEVEYQVIEGGETDINFVIHDPDGVPIITEVRRSESSHKLRATKEGDYRFCLDNTFSRFSHKQVFFEFMTENDDNDDDQFKKFTALPDDLSSFDMKLDDFLVPIGKINQDLTRSVQLTNTLRIIEARDRSILEDNYNRVNFWSSVQLFIMISVGLVQVLMIRSLFEDRSKVGKILKLGT